MPKQVEIKLKPHQCLSLEQMRSHIAKQYAAEDECVIIKKKSLDARNKKKIHFLIRADIYERPQEDQEVKAFEPSTHFSSTCHIIGFGPAGIFAALQALSLGIKPIVLERGKDVKSRRRDLARINKDLVVNPESNYCFGEGGAGTYSDGKLYTRSKKKGDVQTILKAFIQFGADARIGYEAHPHIGTNKLPQIIENMRAFIIEHGGEVHFETKVQDFVIESNELKVLKGSEGEEFNVENVILATGHSARDIYELMQYKNLDIELKPFALGVRVEHPQHLVDEMQYGCPRGDALPAASYSLVHQSNGRGVFSFCMCPGGIIAPAATNDNEVVVNGWSPSKRNGKYANSGMVVQLMEKDFSAYAKYGNLAAMKFQEHIEQKCFQATGSIVAPAQRISNFIQKKDVEEQLHSSYLPGLKSVDIRALLPEFISSRLSDGIQNFAKRMKGFDSEEGIMVATESRTSAPVRIPRNKESLQHTQICNLYPSGEGAGYAGGIVSAAIDGMRCINAIYQKNC